MLPSFIEQKFEDPRRGGDQTGPWPYCGFTVYKGGAGCVETAMGVLSTFKPDGFDGA